MLHWKEEADYCATLLAQGKVIVYPTDTVWGIGCDAMNTEAVRHVFELKHRPPQKSMILLLADITELQRYVSVPDDTVIQKIKAFERPTTVVFPEVKGLPDAVLAPDGSVAFRITKDPFCAALIQASGHPLVSTSANISGGPAAALYPDIDPRILRGADYVVHHRRNDMQIAAPSAIVRFEEDGSTTVLRA